MVSIAPIKMVMAREWFIVLLVLVTSTWLKSKARTPRRIQMRWRPICHAGSHRDAVYAAAEARTYPRWLPQEKWNIPSSCRYNLPDGDEERERDIYI